MQRKETTDDSMREREFNVAIILHFILLKYTHSTKVSQMKRPNVIFGGNVHLGQTLIQKVPVSVFIGHECQAFYGWCCFVVVVVDDDDDGE